MIKIFINKFIMIVFVYEILYFNIMFNKKKNNILFIKIKYCFSFTNTHTREREKAHHKLHSKYIAREYIVCSITYFIFP